MSTVHKNLTGADLHEPKGADTATSGKVYVSNGAGSGVWTDASTIITNTAFTTGDLKATHKLTADTSWILWSDGTIGDGSSGATIRANADTQALFNLYYTYSNTLCPVSGGRGASAAADFAAHKTITLPVGAGRALGLAGSGSGLTARTVGTSVGSETTTIAQANLPSVNFNVSLPLLTIPMEGKNYPVGFNNSNAITLGDASLAAQGPSGGTTSTPLTVTQTGTGTANSGGSGTALSVMDPMTYVNVMIKL